MPTATSRRTEEEVLDQLRTDFPLYAAECLKIVDKEKCRVPFVLNAAQLRLEEALENQRFSGRPQRAIVLKARQVGISTYVQGKLIQRSTLTENHEAIVIAHDRETGGKLYRMGQRMYSFLPDEEEAGMPLKPPIKYHKRATLLHFADPSSDSWQHGKPGLDSTYLVDTAGEFQAGRGGTYQSVHGSEVALWPDINEKLDGLLSGVPKTPDSLVVLESTAKGMNAFKDRWDDAVEGRSDYFPFFWPWWMQVEYSLPFMDKAAREEFSRDVGEGPYGADEPRLLDPGPMDPFTLEPTPLTLEQLHWRRNTIANELGGRVDRFKQEFPATPAEAFIATGQRVFDPFKVQQIIATCDHTDPRIQSAEHPGPRKGRFQAKERQVRQGRAGTIEVPTEPLWVPRKQLEIGESANWKLWLSEDDFDEKTKKLTGDYVAFCDPSGGKLNDTDEPDYHAIQIIDHRTKEQVASYASRIDPDLLAEDLYLAALYFNRPWIGIEVTGGYGLPIARKLWLDYRYTRLYFRTPHDRTKEKQEDRLGWSTDTRTRPIMIANLAQMVREDTHGICCRQTAGEMQTFVRDDAGKAQAESGKYDDRIMAYMGAQQVAREKPIPTVSDQASTGHYGPPKRSYG